MVGTSNLGPWNGYWKNGSDITGRTPDKVHVSGLTVDPLWCWRPGNLVSGRSALENLETRGNGHWRGDMQSDLLATANSIQFHFLSSDVSSWWNTNIQLISTHINSYQFMHSIWLVVSTPLKKCESVEVIIQYSQYMEKIKHVPNHQPGISDPAEIGCKRSSEGSSGAGTNESSNSWARNVHPQVPLCGDPPKNVDIPHEK